MTNTCCDHISKIAFDLFVACEVETPKPIDVHGILGVDKGIVNIAVDSDGKIFSGTELDDNHRKFAHRCKDLQHNGSTLAKRKLKSISGKQSRFQKDTNHRISKCIVRKAQDTHRAITLEILRAILIG
jgi:putative transposase